MTIIYIILTAAMGLLAGYFTAVSWPTYTLMWCHKSNKYLYTRQNDTRIYGYVTRDVCTALSADSYIDDVEITEYVGWLPAKYEDKIISIDLAKKAGLPMIHDKFAPGKFAGEEFRR